MNVLALLSLLVLHLSLQCSQCFGCNYTDPETGKFYDLSPLTRDEKSGYWVRDGNVQFRINVCSRILPLNESFAADQNVNCWRSSIENDQSSGAGVICGRERIRLSVKDEFLQLSYLNGDYCDPEEKIVPRNLHIFLVCDPTMSRNSVGSPKYISTNRCIYTMIWKTWVACESNNTAKEPGPRPNDPNHPSKPSDGPSTFGRTMILLSLILILYFLFGFLYKTFVLKYEGLDSIPHIGSMKALSSYITRWREERRGRYTRLANDHERLVDDTAI